MSSEQSFTNWMPEVAPVDASDAGTVRIDNCGPFVAGSYQRFTLTYTAGRYGIDDTGSLKICYRFASDMGRPQFSDPTAANWVGVVASNGAVLDFRFDQKQNTRPWDRTIYIKVVAGYMREGDTITVSFGTDERGAGTRMQTFVDPEFCFRVLVDPIATYTYVEVPGVPLLPIVPGAAHKWHAVIPTSRARGDVFALNIRADDIWGNPTADCPAGPFRLKGNGPVAALPDEVRFQPGAKALRIEGLKVIEPGLIIIDVLDAGGQKVVSSNTLVAKDGLSLRPYWGDLHAQSGETIGSGSALDYMVFGRDHAFLDMIGHQGNDFQITPQFWSKLSNLMREWNAPGRFVTLPGYEWSGNTALGGDRNVFYKDGSLPIRRSSHALVADRSDVETDCWDAHALFSALGPDFSQTVVWAHCGGRYADIAYAHDHALERSVEIHSSWGTFEWLAADAFQHGYRVGIVGNSDGHKGRPGSEPPGASLFGALGGLTCYWMKELTRDCLFDALQSRHHYATTGLRMHLMVDVQLDDSATVWTDDPRVAGARSHTSDVVMMGDIVACSARRVALHATIAADSAILCIEVRRGSEVLETIRPNGKLPMGRRYRIEWSGAEYRGRARQTVWDGTLKVERAEIVSANPINFLHPDRPLKHMSRTELSWSSITTGNYAGIDLVLSRDDAAIKIETAVGELAVSLADVGHEPTIRKFGKLARELRISRQPDEYAVTATELRRDIDLVAGDNPLWLCASFADGHQAWSSPIYFIGQQ
jgi:Protein of unknown function (DUF3604)